MAVGSNGKDIADGGIGDDFTSVGFDGEYLWIGGSRFSVKKGSKSPRIVRQQVLYGRVRGLLE